MAILSLIILIGIVVVAGIFIAFLGSARQSNQNSGSDDFPALSFDSQNLYRPIRSLKRGIIETVQSSDDPAINAMSGAVIEEMNAAHDRIVLALQTRDELRKASDNYLTAQSEAQRLFKAREAAESPQEKLSYTRAYEAKILEVAEYEKARAIIKKIENEIELTKASMSQLKAKLTFSEASTNASERAEDLRTTLGSLETIQSSVDEAQLMLRS
jgi:hypothetical protein